MWCRCCSCSCRGVSRRPWSWWDAEVLSERGQEAGGGGGSRHRPGWKPCPWSEDGLANDCCDGPPSSCDGGCCSSDRPWLAPAHGSPRADRQCSPSSAARSLLFVQACGHHIYLVCGWKVLGGLHVGGMQDSTRYGKDQALGAGGLVGLSLLCDLYIFFRDG